MSTYTFGPFALFPNRFVLASNGASQQLTPRLLAVLQYLITNRNRVVTKEELITEVWNGSFIEEGIVARTVSTLRALIGDIAENPKYIQTISRVGYRFIHPVSIQYDDSPLPAGNGDVATRNWDCCFVGRHNEIGFFNERLVTCEQGTGSILCIAGPTGIGKTALGERLLSQTEGRAVVARSRCAPGLAGTEPYAPFIDAFTDLFNASMDADLRRRLVEVAPTWASQTASAFDQRADTAVTIPDLPHSVARQFIAAVTEISRRQPIVVFIDDFHWADTASVHLVALLSLRLAQMRLLLIMTARCTELLRSAHPFVQLSHELELKGTCHQVRLNALSLEEVAEFMEVAAPAAFDAKERLVQCVYRHCEGNPLFMISALRYFESTGALSEMEGKWCVEPTWCHTALTMPPNVERLFLHTLELVDSDDQYLLKVASLQGLEFDSAMLSNVSGVPLTEVEERLRSFARVYALIRHLGDSELNDGAPTQHYRFVHALFWKALQDSIVPSRRIAVQSQIAGLRGLRQKQTS
jgi:DNA-binding winged helix-turn-helix (wHTH) protein/predicted ATPase